MTTLEDDLAYFEAGNSELEAYLLSDELFWPLSGFPGQSRLRFPRLTLGGLLLARERAQARALAPAEQAVWTRLDRQLDATRRRWRVAWEKKAAREFTSRLNQWRNYLADFRQDPEANADYYPQEVRWRVMMHLLERETTEIPEAELELMKTLDIILRESLVSGPFIWEQDLTPGFTLETYWFLFSSLQG